MQRFLFICCAVAVLLLGGQHTSAQTAVDSVKITLTGENFTRQSTVFVGSTQYTPTYNDPTKLTITIPRSMITSAQPNNVRVVNPSAGGGSSNSIPIVVTCRTAEPIQLASFSMMIKTTTYSDLSEARNESTLTEGQKMNLTLSRMPYVSKTVLSGKYLRNGNIDVTITMPPVTDNPFTDAESLSSPQQIRTIFMNSERGKAVYVNARNDTVGVTDIDSVPFKPITDYLRNMMSQINAPANRSVIGAAAAAGPAPLPPPSDPNIRNSILLADAYREGFTITQISPGRYSVMIDSNANVPLRTREKIRMRVKAPEDIIERYEIFRENLLQYRVRFSYDAPVPGTSVPRLRQTLATQFYVLDGLPLQQVVRSDYENFMINITQ